MENNNKPKNTGHFQLLPSCRTPDPRKEITLRIGRKEFSRRFHHVLDQAKAGDVILVRAGTAIGKTFASRAYVRSKGIKAAFFVPTHRVGQDEYEDPKRLSNAKRLKSFDQLVKEGDLPCPSVEIIVSRRNLGFEFEHSVCNKCTAYRSTNQCPLYKQFDEVQAAPYRILTHAHLELPKARLDELLTGVEIVFMDESFLDSIYREEIITVADLRHLLALINSLQDQTHTAKPIRIINRLLTELSKEHPSKTFALDVSDFSKYLAKPISQLKPIGKEKSRKNVYSTLQKACKLDTPLVIRARVVGDYIRHEAVLSRKNLIPDHVPVVILDATGEKEVYKRLLGRPVTEVHLDEFKIKRHARIIQDLRRGYNASSLFMNELAPAKAGVDVPDPAVASAFGLPVTPEKDELTPLAEELFKEIEGQIEDESQCLFISTLRLEPFLKARFPKAKCVHFNDLKSRNDLQNFHQYFIIGYPAMSDFDLAKTSREIFGQPHLSARDAALEARKRKKSGARRFSHFCDPKNGCCYGVEDPCFEDKDMSAVWRMKCRAEIVQAVGRARPEVPKKFAQTIYIYCNVALPIEVDEFILPKSEFSPSLFQDLVFHTDDLLWLHEDIDVETITGRGYSESTVRRHLAQLEVVLDLTSYKAGKTKTKTMWRFRQPKTWASLLSRENRLRPQSISTRRKGSYIEDNPIFDDSEA